MIAHPPKRTTIHFTKHVKTCCVKSLRRALGVKTICRECQREYVKEKGVWEYYGRYGIKQQ